MMCEFAKPSFQSLTYLVCAFHPSEIGIIKDIMVLSNQMLQRKKHGANVK